MESLVAWGSLSKNPPLRLIVDGKVSKKISGKVVIMISKQDAMKAAGSLQVGARQEAGAGTAIHAVRDIFKDHTTEAVLLVDAENAFNTINRKAMLYNVSVICPITSTYLNNSHNTLARLFIIEETENWSMEEIVQEDPTCMAAYVLGLTPMMQHLREIASCNKLYSKGIVYANDFTIAGPI